MMGFEQSNSNVQTESVGTQLNLLREGLARQAYPGYPELADRLVMHPADLSRDDAGRFVLPEGPWTVDTHPDQPFPEVAPTPAKQQELLDQGYALDARGRPLHPWLLKMIADPLIGAVLGKGSLWEWGANRTADAVVIKNGHVLLIRRSDVSEWGLPGGFIDPGEGGAAAAVREVAEETGLQLPDALAGVNTYSGPVADTRLTAHAWPETESYLFDLGEDDDQLPEVRGLDDASEAAWVPLTSLTSEAIALFGSHRALLLAALGNLTSNAVQELDLAADELTALLAEAPVYRKTGLVRIRPAVAGETITTVLADGTVETVNTAGENQYVIEAASGEEYIIDADRLDRYEATEEPGVFRAKGMVRAIDNPTGRPIEITAPWGEKQYGKRDCKLAVVYDPAQPEVVGTDRDIIGAEEFAGTYGLVDDDQ
jgi:ADP-ribose pyrophosphatase YjhB (NUDIX family)